jgi:apolipoprotein D and lipocalin family protein
MRKILIGLILVLTGCVGIPEDIKPVDNFEIEKYLGRWYEIARLDHSFERGLTRKHGKKLKEKPTLFREEI